MLILFTSFKGGACQSGSAFSMKEGRVNTVEDQTWKLLNIRRSNRKFVHLIEMFLMTIALFLMWILSMFIRFLPILPHKCTFSRNAGHVFCVLLRIENLLVGYGWPLSGLSSDFPPRCPKSRPITRATAN